jgi:hypothetical protein
MTEIEVNKPKVKNKFIHLETIFDRLKIPKNQRPPAELAPAPSRGHPHTPSLVADLLRLKYKWL